MTVTTTENPFADFTSGLTAMLTQDTVAANALAEKLKHFGNEAKLVHEIRDEREDVEDEKVLSYRKFMEAVNEKVLAAQAEIEEHIKANLMPKSEEGEDKETLQAQYKEIANRVKKSRDLIESLPTEVDLSSVPELIRVSGTRTSSSGATGIRRFRLASITLDGTLIQNDKGKSTLTDLRTAIVKLHKDDADYKVPDSATIREHLIRSAGTDDLSSLNGAPIEFSIGQHQIVATPAVSDNE